MRRFSIADWLFAGLLVWTVVVSAATIQREFFSPPRSVGARNASHVASWRALASVGFRRGRVDSPRSVVVFSDFECPYCRRFAAVLDSLHQEHPEVLIVERHFPIVELHDAAFNAALAAECAGKIGRYAEMRQFLYERRQLVANEQWGAVAAFAGVADTASLVSCVRKQEYRARVDTDVAVAHRLGIDGTPSTVINDSLYGGTMSLDVLETRLGLPAKSSSPRS